MRVSSQRESGGRAFVVVFVALAALLSPSVASALDIDLNFENVFKPPTAPVSDLASLPPLADLVIEPSGDVARTGLLSEGDWISLSITVANPDNELFTGVFVSLVYQPDEVHYLGRTAVADTILEGGTPDNPLALNDVGSGSHKTGQPCDPGWYGPCAAGVWIQALAYGSRDGTDGAGPDVALTFVFEALGPALGREILFDLTMTAGDATDASVLNMSDAVLVAIPEPGTGLLVGLGLGGLAAASRHRPRRATASIRASSATNASASGCLVSAPASRQRAD